MKTLTFAVAAALLIARPVAAQETHAIFDVTPYIVMVSGNVADIVTTGQAFNRGAHEGNGITSTNQIAPLALSKACAILGMGLTMRLLELHGHPRLAKAVGYLDGGITFGAAIHNTKVAR